MGFTTTTFLFIFLPLLLVFYFVIYLKMRKRKSVYKIGNFILIFFSFIFYSWALAITANILLIFSVIVWLIGLWIEHARSSEVVVPMYKNGIRNEKTVKIAVIPLTIGVVTTIGLLFHFKYYATIAPLISQYAYIDPNKYASITVPLGISFISFSVISYYADIYLEKASAGGFSDCLLYIFFFPKIISGPIVLWREFQEQLKARDINVDTFVSGINLIVIGFAKKVILADTFGAHADTLKGQCIDTPTAWFGWILYALQIYYDFAGYSDVAIGTARLFGFNISKNFDFPYRSISITEFWRRWHISLGNFFKNYIYFPLGGNRKGQSRTLANLFIVFVITGIWHGAGMAYIIWGTLHGICVVIERSINHKQWYASIPNFLKWVFTFFISASAWQFFRYGGNGISAFAALGQLFGLHGSYTSEDILFPLGYYADNKVIVLILIGFIGATILGDKRILNLYEKLKANNVFYLLQEVTLIILFVISISFMVSSSYNPFIYFQF